MKITSRASSFSAMLVALSVLSVATPTWAEHGRDYDDRSKHEFRHDGKDRKDSGASHYERKMVEKLKQKHASHREQIKRYIDELPEAERESIKAEFKAIRDERKDNERRMQALKERIKMHRGALEKRMDDQEHRKPSREHHEMKRCVDMDDHSCDMPQKKQRHYSAEQD